MNDSSFRIIARGDAAVPPLTPREADIILRKATEAPWSGEYEKNTAAGWRSFAITAARIWGMCLRARA